MVRAKGIRARVVELFVVAAVLAAAIGLREIATPWIGRGYPFVTIFPAVTILAWWRGVRTGASAVILGWFLANLLYIQPRGYALPATGGDWVGGVLFLGAGSLIVALGEVQRRVNKKAARGERAAGLMTAIIESSDDAIISKTLDGVITSWNPGAERLFGYTAAEAVGRPITSLIIPPERLAEEAAIIDQVSHNLRVDHFQTERVGKGGRRVQLSITVSPVRDSAGRVIGASKIARDISPQVEAQQERERLLESERAARGEAERLGRVKDDFVATLSHELRTPLNAILGWSHLVRKAGSDQARITEGLAVIERNARAQSQMIEDLLDVSRIVSGKLRLDVQRVDMLSVIEQAIASAQPAADAKRIQLETALGSAGNIVRGDATRLQQIVWNLISNATKFTPRDGRIRIAMERAGSSVRVSVSDTGKGIKPEFLAEVFHRFRQEDSSTTRRFGGLGLGLAIVKHLAELHGGSVRAESEGEGKGATFTVELPLADIDAEPPVDDMHGRLIGAMAEGPSFELRGVKVLVVDDEPDSRELVQRVLTECDAEVRTADSAIMGMSEFRSMQPDVVLSDIGMPDQDGYDFIRAIRGLAPDQGGTTPAAALTALARTEDRTRALLAGFQLHVAKPIEPSELVAVVLSLSKLRSKSGKTRN